MIHEYSGFAGDFQLRLLALYVREPDQALVSILAAIEHYASKTAPAKTGTPVYTVLPDFVVRALEATPKMTERYYFWTGVGKLCTAVRM